jgi:P-type Cu2+ transporter
METDSKLGHSGHGTTDHMHMHQGESRTNVQAHSGHNEHAGHSVAMFRDKFWLSLGLTLPVVFWSGEVQHSLGYPAPTFPGSRLIPAILGTIIFLYGGSVFIQGARHELSRRQPGMMTLISLGIVAALVASLASTLGIFEVDVCWELATLISVMLLGHWLEMKAVAQAHSASMRLPLYCQTQPSE